MRERAAVVQDTAAAQHLAGCLRWRYGRPDSADAAPRQGVEPPRAPQARPLRPARTRKRSICRHRHCRPSAAAGACPRSVARFGWAQPNRAGNARTRGDGPGAQWALPCFRDTATHGRQRAGPSFLVPLSLSLDSSPPSPCRVLWDWWGPLLKSPAPSKLELNHPACL